MGRVVLTLGVQGGNPYGLVMVRGLVETVSLEEMAQQEITHCCIANSEKLYLQEVLQAWQLASAQGVPLAEEPSL